MPSRHPLIGVLGFTAFVMNPSFACSASPSEDEFQYGEADMIAAMKGTWQLTYTRPDVLSTVTFTLDPGPAPSGALAAPGGLTPQCGTRTFTRPAAACIAMSQLWVKATIHEAEPPIDAADGSGSYTVSSLTYTGGRLEVKFGSDLGITAYLDAGNEVRQTEVAWQGVVVTSVLNRFVTP